MVCLQGFDEDLGDRQTVIRQIVIGERAGLVAIVEKHQPPAARGRHLVLRDEGKVGGVERQIGARSLFHCCAKAGTIFCTSASAMAVDSLMTAICGMVGSSDT